MLLPTEKLHGNFHLHAHQHLHSWGGSQGSQNPGWHSSGGGNAMLPQLWQSNCRGPAPPNCSQAAQSKATHRSGQPCSKRHVAMLRVTSRVGWFSCPQSFSAWSVKVKLVISLEVAGFNPTVLRKVAGAGRFPPNHSRCSQLSKVNHFQRSNQFHSECFRSNYGHIITVISGLETAIVNHHALQQDTGQFHGCP